MIGIKQFYILQGGENNSEILGLQITFKSCAFKSSVMTNIWELELICLV